MVSVTVIPFLNNRFSLTKNRFVVAQFIAPLTFGFLFGIKCGEAEMQIAFGVLLGVFAWVFLRISSSTPQNLANE